ncbi:TPA: hypothetical protein SMF76_002136 [Serratia marcescens]|nr:hypothetical protein [Serratia marcescens]HEJ7073405.1 hypothetical protein [Serratia marcescens]HEJ7196460.1 hypothetical protein [Serratia marcescens]
MGKVNDRLLDETLAHALFVSRYSTGVAQRMVKILNQADAELSSKLLMALDDLDPQSFTVRRLDSLLAGVRDINRQVYQQLYGALSDELGDFIGYEGGFQFSLFDSLLPDLVKQRYRQIQRSGSRHTGENDGLRRRFRPFGDLDVENRR